MPKRKKGRNPIGLALKAKKARRETEKVWTAELNAAKVSLIFSGTLAFATVYQYQGDKHSF